MCSKQQLKKFLEEICTDAEFAKFKYVSPENYNIWIKCRTEKDRETSYYNEYIKEWIKKFANFTSTAWIVKRSFPNLQRLLYRKIYDCHHSSRNKTKLLLRNFSRNKNCRARIDFKVKIINYNTMKNDTSLREGLNLNIYIEFNHTHEIRTTEALNRLKSTHETDNMFLEYFKRGYIPSSAKCYHELFLILNHGLAEDEVAKSDINPDIRHLFYLQGKKLTKPALSVNEVMSEKINQIEEKGGILVKRAKLKVVITPLMKNIVSGYSLEEIIIESTSIKDGFITFFFVPTQLGVLPIASALHEESTEVAFIETYSEIKEVLEKLLNKTFEPNLIMSNDVQTQLNALILSFPNSVSCSFRSSKCRTVWDTLCDDGYKIDSKKRHGLMLLFYRLIYAKDAKQAHTCHQELVDNQSVKEIEPLQDYLNNIWNDHTKYMLQSNNRNIDISLYAIKEFIKYKCYAFNTVTMIDTLVNILDKYWSQIICAFLRKKFPMDAHTKCLPKNKIVLSNLKDLKVKNNMYKIKPSDYSEKDQGKFIIKFRSDTMCCDCEVGRKGRFCEHLTALIHSFEVNIDLTEKERKFYSNLVGEMPQEDIQDETKMDAEIDENEDEMSANEDNQLTDEELSNEKPEGCYFLVKDEIKIEETDIEDNTDDPDVNMTEIKHIKIEFVDETDSVNNSEQLSETDINTEYENALKCLNGEFQRLNSLFKENPNPANLNNVISLIKELSKIKAVESVDLSNVCVTMNYKNNI